MLFCASVSLVMLVITDANVWYVLFKRFFFLLLFRWSFFIDVVCVNNTGHRTAIFTT